MSEIDARAAALPEVPLQPVAIPPEDSIPAARLLAHDLEPLTWDHDGDGALPPPD